jgi:hypothetical protein
MRRLCLITLATMVAFAADASADASWMLGVKGGAGIATIGGDDAGDAASRTTFAGGLFAQADLSENFALRFEGLYFGKGATDDEPGFDGSFKFDYVEFPMLLVGQVPVSDAATLSAFAGPTVGVNVGAQAELDFGGFVLTGDIDEDIADFEFGLAFGVGGAFDAGGDVVIVIDARYDFGLTSIDEGLADSGEELDLQNRAWAFMAGVGFRLR